MTFCELPGGIAVNTSQIVALKPHADGTRTRVVLQGREELVVAGSVATVKAQLEAADRGERIRGPRKTVTASSAA